MRGWPHRASGVVSGATLLALVVALAGACDKRKASTPHAAAAARAEEPGTAECAVCAMVVREQPAPRGQLVYRDGSRQFFCSLAEMAQQLGVPSAKGKPVSAFVEVLEAGDDPARPSVTPHPWTRAEDASYVVGIARPGIMGRPALAYGALAEAKAVAKAHGGTVLAFGAALEAVLAVDGPGPKR